MKNFFLIFFFALFTLNSFGQKEPRLSKDEFYQDGFDRTQRDSIDYNENEISVELDGDTHYTDYKIINYKRDTTVIDTTLSMQKDYKFNFIRKDIFELMAFHNQGQTFNNLGYDFSSSSYIPQMGMRAKHFIYKEIEDIYYYEVPTPTTELMWRSGLKQGQTLDALITMNMSPRFNISFGYNGMRSLGKYRRTLASLGNFRTTVSYRTENNRYYIRGHYVAHKNTNQENGGLTEQSIILFESNDKNYYNRGRLDVNFKDAENELTGRRYHIEHDYKFFREKDSISEPTNLKLGHYLTYERKHYKYTQSQNDAFGDAFETKINDDTGFNTMNNMLFLELDSPYILGTLIAKTNYYNYNHFFNGVVNLVDETVESQLTGNALSVGAEWDANIKDFNFNADASSIISGDIDGHSLMVAATYKTDSVFDVTARVSIVSKTPNFNFLHFQSDYIDYNWQNLDFKNEQIRSLSLDFHSEKWLDISASITQMDNYTYFDSISKPQQAANTVNYLKVKAFKSFTFFRKFSLDNTLMYQNVSSDENVFRVPEFVTRNSLYYSNHLFKNKPLYLQTGITFKYFSKYQMNAYNPLLSEFYLQDVQYGGYPLFDFFVDAEVRRMRLFFKIENILSRYTGRDYYSAPLNPYRDFNIRFGVVWNFFI